jgi:N-sulfoglucosamine sulfohydrolase
MKYPNILYIHSHDTGRYVQPYGHNIPTPNIQRLAEEGILFRQSFCAAPTCSPSRASLLTGQCAHSSGMLGLAHRGFSLNDYGQHIVHTLRQAGYQSTLIGVQHVAAEPDVIGYDQVIPLESHLVRHVAPATIQFLDSSPSQPFFLSVGFAETHREFHVPNSSENARFCLPPHPLPDIPETRHDMAAFKASARVLDRGIGAVLDALEANGLAEDTLVICTTDHGIAFPGIKCNLTDQGIGVMLIIRGPGGFGAASRSVNGVGSDGRVCDAMVSHIDLFPTICDLLQIEPPTWLQGKSMLPLIRGEAEQIHLEIFAEVTYHAAYEPQRAVRTPRWKYIRRFQDRPGPVLPNCDDSPSKDVWLWHGWQDRPPAREQLYDLIFDPNEAHSLAEQPSMATVLNEMRDRLARWMQVTHDPLLRGPVPAPPGARVNDPDGLSPAEPTRVIGHEHSS